CFLPDLTRLASGTSAANLPKAPYHGYGAGYQGKQSRIPHCASGSLSHQPGISQNEVRAALRRSPLPPPVRWKAGENHPMSGATGRPVARSEPWRGAMLQGKFRLCAALKGKRCPWCLPPSRHAPATARLDSQWQLPDEDIRDGASGGGYPA